MADNPSLARQAIEALDAALAERNALDRMRLIDRALRLHREAAAVGAAQAMPRTPPSAWARPSPD